LSAPDGLALIDARFDVAALEIHGALLGLKPSRFIHLNTILVRHAV
jgi:hypothetical protein